MLYDFENTQMYVKIQLVYFHTVGTHYIRYTNGKYFFFLILKKFIECLYYAPLLKIQKIFGKHSLACMCFFSSQNVCT